MKTLQITYVRSVNQEAVVTVTVDENGDVTDSLEDVDSIDDLPWKNKGGQCFGIESIVEVKLDEN